jgi:hypothetical protein
VATGAPKKGRFAERGRLAATFSTFARHSPVLLICADLAIATVPAAAQSFSFGGFGIAGGLGALGLFHHGFGGGYRGAGRGLGPPGFITADLVLPDEGSKGGLLGASPGDSRSFANDPLSAPMAGSNEVLLIGRVRDNRLGLVRGSSRRRELRRRAMWSNLSPLAGSRTFVQGPHHGSPAGASAASWHL